MKDSPVILDESTRTKLIELGNCSDSLRDAELCHDLKPNAFLQAPYPGHFESLLQLDWACACSLVKGLTKAENANVSRYRGSVSLVRPAYDVLERSDPVGALELAAWIVQNSDNDYIPFPMRKIRYAFESILSLAPKSWEECRERLNSWRLKEWARQKAVAEEIEQQPNLAKERRRIQKAVNAKLQAEQGTIQRAASIVRRNVLDDLQRSSQKERWEHIAHDTVHPLDYYTDLMPELDPTVVVQLDNQTRAMLLKKLSVIRKGIWGELSKKLNSVFDTAI